VQILQHADQWPKAQNPDVMALQLELQAQREQSQLLVKQLTAHVTRLVDQRGRRGGGPYKHDRNGQRIGGNYPSWMITPPGYPTETKIQDNRLYTWCTKWRNGQGLWACRHNTETHMDGFRLDRDGKRHSDQPFLYRNLTKAQQQKLHLHERCAHVHWDLLNSLICQGILPCDKVLANTPDPVCASCHFGKAHRRSHAADTGHIGRLHSEPGTGVSSDGMEAGVPGRMMTTGGSPSSKTVKYCTFWIDHHSHFMYVTMHDSKRAEELLSPKHKFEDFATRFGVSIKNIRADNGVYTAKIIHDSCQKKQQNLTFSAVGAHWQNGIAERFIGTIVQRA